MILFVCPLPPLTSGGLQSEATGPNAKSIQKTTVKTTDTATGTSKTSEFLLFCLFFFIFLVHLSQFKIQLPFSSLALIYIFPLLECFFLQVILSSNILLLSLLLSFVFIPNSMFLFSFFPFKLSLVISFFLPLFFFCDSPKPPRFL